MLDPECGSDRTADRSLGFDRSSDDYPVDFEMGNHFVSTWPESPFVNRILLRALTDDGRISLMNRELTVRSGEQTVRSELADRRPCDACWSTSSASTCQRSKAFACHRLPSGIDASA